jgi:hypothetical protein
MAAIARERIAMLARLTLAPILVLLAVAPASAAPEPKSLNCKFGMGITHVYEKGAFMSERAAPLAFGIASIDTAAQTADLKTDSGTGTLRLVQAVNAMHFLEVAIEGALYITTVFDKDDATGTYPAVHSRHFALLGQPIVTHYQGFCQESD